MGGGGDPIRSALLRVGADERHAAITAEVDVERYAPGSGAAEEFDVDVHSAGVEPWLAGRECGRCLLGTGSERGEAVRVLSSPRTSGRG